MAKKPPVTYTATDPSTWSASVLPGMALPAWAGTAPPNAPLATAPLVPVTPVTQAPAPVAEPAYAGAPAPVAEPAYAGAAWSAAAPAAPAFGSTDTPLLPPGPLTAAADLPPAPAEPAAPAVPLVPTGNGGKGRRPLTLVLAVVAIAALAAVAAFVYPGFLNESGEEGVGSGTVRPTLTFVQAPASVAGLKVATDATSLRRADAIKKAMSLDPKVKSASSAAYTTLAKTPVYFVGGIVTAGQKVDPAAVIAGSAKALGRSSGKALPVKGSAIGLVCAPLSGTPAMQACAWGDGQTYGMAASTGVTPSKATALTLLLRDGAIRQA